MRPLRRSGRLGVATLVSAMVVMFAPAATAGAVPSPSPSTYTVGVDFANPTGHNFAAVDYFPRGSGAYPLDVHSGDVIDFKWNAGSPDQLHTATFLKAGQLLPAFYAANQIIVPDGDAETPPLQFLFPPPTFPPAGSGAPSACGDAANPCTYDGSADLSSGANPTAPGGDFFVKVTAPVSATPYTYACIIHPGMVGHVTVVPGVGTTPAVAATEAVAQTGADLTEAAAAEAAVGPATSVLNGDGTRTFTAVAGTGSAHTEVLEMLPADLPLHHGDHVTWKTTTVKDVHTVTFPYGSGSNSVDPFKQTVCEGPGAADPLAPGGPPPDFGCAAGTSESPLAAAPEGPTAIGPHGYRTVATDGGIFTHGDASFLGSEGATRLNKPIVGMATTPDGRGYWSVATDGGIFTHGNASFFGSEGATPLNKPVVGMAPTPDGQGYGLVASDGGIFTHGDFPFLGSTGNLKLNKPVVAMDTTHGFAPPGYWLAASDGGIFSFGPGAQFFGSMGGVKLTKPVVGMAATPDGGGYWEVASDGGIFTFGDARFFGSLGATHLNAPIVGMAATPSGQGYLLVAADGGIFTFGDASFFGSEGGIHLTKPVTGMSMMPATATTSGIIGAAPSPTTTPVYTFTGVGDFTYQCRIHDHMRGIIISS